MSEYLFIGGPKHGEYLDVEDGQEQHTVFARPAPVQAVEAGVPILAGSTPSVPVTYRRRELNFEADGGIYTQVIFVLQNIGPDSAAMAVQGILLVEWAKRGTFKAAQDAAG